MKIKMKIAYQPIQSGAVLDAIISPDKEMAVVFDPSHNQTYICIPKCDFELVAEEIKPEPNVGLPAIFGQQLESMTVNFK